jgi:hypothetical protein
MNKFSPNELILFNDFGLGHLCNTPISVWSVYQEAIELAFIENWQSPIVDALKRAVKHIRDGGLRNNDKFEKLLEYNGQTN